MKSSPCLSLIVVVAVLQGRTYIGIQLTSSNEVAYSFDDHSWPSPLPPMVNILWEVIKAQNE